MITLNQDAKNRLDEILVALRAQQEDFLPLLLEYAKIISRIDAVRLLDDEEGRVKACQVLEEIFAHPLAMEEGNPFRRASVGFYQDALTVSSDELDRVIAPGLIRNPLLPLWIDNDPEFVINIVKVNNRRQYTHAMEGAMSSPAYENIFRARLSERLDAMGIEPDPSRYFNSSKNGPVHPTLVSKRVQKLSDPLVMTQFILLVREAFDLQGDRLILQYLLEEP